MRRKYNNWSIQVFIILVMGIIYLSGCKKDKIEFDGLSYLEFSTDTLSFDTLFVSLGSTTQYFTVKNNHKKSVEIQRVYLKNIASNSYRLTIDGGSGNEADNIIIPGKDSIYIFVEVTVDPNDQGTPFVLLDEVVFETSSEKQKVVLQAYGQNARFYNGETIQTETWTNELPYVILNSLEVEEGHTLTIKEGVTVYFGGNSGMFVNGTLNIEGGQDTSQWVTFRGYRLDTQVTGVAYDRLPGQWLGVFLMRGHTRHEITNFRMRGSEFGLNVGTTTIDELNEVNIDNAPELRITNSEIYNHSVYGIYGFLAKIHATNLLIYNVGRNAFTVSLGGEYRIEHSTFYLGSSGFFEHKEPALYFSDYHIYSKDAPALKSDLTVDLINSVAGGTTREEILFDLADENQNLKIEHSSLKFTEPLPTTVQAVQVLVNEDNGFENPLKSDFRLKENSVLIDKGKDIHVLFDIAGNPRSSNPDIGAFEF